MRKCKRPLVYLFFTMVIIVIIRGYFYTKEKLIDEESVYMDLQGIVYKMTVYSKGTCLWIKCEDEKILIFLDDFIEDEIKTGNEIKINAMVSKNKSAKNEGGFDAAKYYLYTYGITYSANASKKDIIVTDVKINFIKHHLYKLKKSLCEVLGKIFNERDAGILKAILYGDKSGLDKGVKDLFQMCGISHILAISGLHISIVSSIIYKILLKATGSIRLATFITIPFIFLYGIMTDFSVSTNRAVVMMIIMLIGKLLGRTYDILSAVSFSGIIILIQNPLLIYASGFQLSFLAIFALVVVVPRVYMAIGFEADDIVNDKILKERGVIISQSDYVVRYLIKAVVASVSVSFVTLPVILWNFYEFNFLSILLNILIIPLMTYVVGIALLACVLGFYNLQIAEFFGGSVHYLLEIIIRMCEVLNKIRIGHFLSGKPAIIWIVIYYLVFFLGLLLASNWNKFGKTILVIPFVALLIFSPKKDGKLYVKMLDVGQGDGICIITPSREVIFVDGGSSSLSDLGSEVLMPFLKANGISKIDYVMISHCDTDHISGIKELMEQELIPIDNIVVSEKENDIINLAKANGISIQYLCAGDVVRNEDISIKILAPDTINKNNMEDRNNESQVFLLEHGEFNMIFTGDVGSDELKKLAEEYELQVDILKAPHHGSNNSACYEFIKEIDAEYAMISAGKNNLYGHPGEDFIQLLEDNGCKYDITYKNGQITVVSDGEEFWVKEMIYKK